MPEPPQKGAESAGAFRPDPRLIAGPADFASALRVLRAQSGLSFRRVAALLNKDAAETVSVSTLSGWFNGAHLPTSMLAGAVPRLLAVLGEEDPAEVAAWLAALERVRVRPGPRPSGAAPFRGLEAYGPEHAEYFCGRGALTAGLLDLAERAYARGTPAIVVGPSGSGKSSLLGAGLVPAWPRRGSAAGRAWSHRILTPGDRPVLELARLLYERTRGEDPPEEARAALSGADAAKWTESIEGDILDDPASCVRWLEAGNARNADETGDPGRILIVVDQFEELFTSVEDEAQRQSFVEALFALAGAPPGAGDVPAGTPPALVVLGMRADFYTRAVQIPRLVPVLQDAQLVVGPMSEAELREVLTEPARRANLALSTGLVELLVRDMAPAGGDPAGAAHDPGTLPLLSHALLATWMQAKGRMLTAEHYRAGGGVRGAVARTAEEAFTALAPAQRDVARRLFLRLVRIEQGASDTRRRVPYDELRHGADREAGPVREVLDQFIVARLVTADRAMVEISHEVLIGAWPRLREWLAADRDWLRVRGRLTADAARWLESGRDPDTLYRGGSLQVAREWADERGRRPELNALEARFLDAGIARRAEEQRRARRRARRLRRLVAALSALLLVSALLTVYAFQQRGVAERERTTASSRLTAAWADRLREQDVSLSMQLALAAYRMAPTAEARSSLLNSTAVPAATRLRPAAGKATRVAVRADGRLLAAGTDLGSVELWTADGDGRFRAAGSLPAGAGGPVAALALSADGRILAAAGDRDRSIRLWSVADPARPVAIGAPAVPAPPVASMALTPDGRALAAGGEGKRVYLWSLARLPAVAPPVALAGPTGAIKAVALAPGGRTLAAGGKDRVVRLWDIADPARPRRLATLTGPASQVFSIAVSPDGGTLAAGTGAQHSVYLWRISDPRRPRRLGAPLTGPASWVNAVAFSADGAVLAAASSDKLVWLFDVAGRRAVGRLPHPSPVVAAVHRDAHSFVTLGEDGTVRAWMVPGPVITGPADTVFGLSFDAAGRRLGIAPGSRDNTVTVWSPTDIQRPVRLGRPARNAPDAVPYSGAGTLTPDGRVFAVGDTAGGIQLWDVADPARPARLGPAVPAAADLVESVTASGDGRLLAVGADDGAVHLVDITDPRRPVKGADLTGPAKLVYNCAISRDGRLLAAASGDGDAYLWDIADRRRPRRLATLAGSTTDEAYAVAFSPDGRTLAVGKANGSVQLWDVTHPGAPGVLGAPLTGPASVVYSLAFGPGAPTLAVGDTDNTVWLWDLARPRDPVHLATLTGPTMSVLSVAFSPDGRTVAAGGHDHTVRLWDVDPESAAAFVCAVAGQPVTRQEWTRYVSGRKYDPPCR
ncbi:nSTAND1 domain-containing NTPase [Actinomadura fibrosa]|uniref:Novel STAND NTPase 1 domain-containing protein n=1 Tax=Actinomadura fibrosa TaxID=111802 RepID=A0ABW2XY18_9ACTN